ncbi:MAG: hypothetical protein KF708_19855 [Pirellulales bacterium]|nr:hypothetical protein [Pirellulales bacterium]
MRKFAVLALLFLGMSIARLGETSAADPVRPLASSIARSVVFELTFDNHDLVWLGDPASPTTSVHVRAGARPLATDLCVTTMAENHAQAGRRYLREARITSDGKERTVRAFTTQREVTIGTIDAQGRFLPNDSYLQNKNLLPSWPQDVSALEYDAEENALYYTLEGGGPAIRETLDFLPLDLRDGNGRPIAGEYSIAYEPAESDDRSAAPVVTLNFEHAGKSIPLATATLPQAFRRDDLQLESYDNASGTYLPETAYRPGGERDATAQPSATLSVAGKFTAAINAGGPNLVFKAGQADRSIALRRPKIEIDGNFDDWRNVAGIDDQRGDVVPYLEYVPDVDLLEFKVAHDDEHLYLYARVAGQVGRTHPHGGRAYFYAYMDVDQNPETGFLPTRDDDCYYGVDIGDDCEVQFEFVDNKFRKTFYGFCGIGGNENVLKQQVTLGKSIYGRLDEQGNERPNYKAEYTFRAGKTEITEDLKLGTSDSILLAISPDGREVEVVSSLAGFLKDPQGKPTVQLGQTIDIAAGMESDSKAYPGKTRWGADSTPAIRGYRLEPNSTASP